MAEIADVEIAQADTVEAVVRRTVDLSELPGAFDGYTNRQVIGRTLVRVSGALG